MRTEIQKIAKLQKITTILYFIIVALICISLGFIVYAVSDKKEKETVIEIKTVAEVEPVIEEEPIEIKYYDVPLDTDLQDYIRTTCEFYGIDMDLVIAIISCESGFQPDVISTTHDYGLMQINQINLHRLADELNITDILDPKQNVLSGIHLFAEHFYNSDENIEYALLKYNCGNAGAKRLWDNGIRRTKYTEKILNAYAKIKAESDGVPYEETVIR